MGVKGAGLGVARVKGGIRKKKRACESGWHNKLAGIRKHSAAVGLDMRPDPFQKTAVFKPAEATDGFCHLAGGGYRRGGHVG